MFHAFAVLYVPLIVSVVGLVAGAANGERVLAAAAAALGACFLALSAVLLDAQQSRAPSQATPPREAARAQAVLLAVGWAWAGVAMLAVYLLSGLKWQHGWQYGSGMVLVGAAILAYAQALRREGGYLASPAGLRLASFANLAQGLAAAVAVVWLVSSGKLATTKGDWAANDIFLAGGAAIVVLVAIARLGAARRTPLAPRG